MRRQKAMGRSGGNRSTHQSYSEIRKESLRRFYANKEPKVHADNGKVVDDEQTYIANFPISAISRMLQLIKAAPNESERSKAIRIYCVEVQISMLIPGRLFDGS